MRFTVLKDFFSPETKSQYSKGLSYTARPQDEVLLALVPQWVTEGKVELGGPSAEVSGEG